MGVVWQAHDMRLDRTVAVKQMLMQPGLGEAEREAATARAMREGRIAARLQHPHAISVYDVALDDIDDLVTGGRAVPWLIMEYLPSRSLAAVLAERGTLPPRDVARIGRQIAAALAAAHRAGIVHRDVKPGNVLIGEDGIVKITDFGISRASWEAAVTRTGVVAGTPAYFAPEVARGEPRDPAADVFSLGSTLYAAVEGEPPFGLDDNTLALLRTVAEGRVRPPQQAGPLSALLMRMLRADPAQRPTMPDAVVALGAVAHGGSRARPARRFPPTATAVDLPAIPAHGGSALPIPAQEIPPRTPTMQQAPQPDPPRNRRPGQRMILLGAAVGLVILLGVVAFAAQRAPDEQQAADPGTPPTSTGLAPAPSAPAPPGPAELEQAVRTYYGLLPDDTTTAWAFLGPFERARAGGFAEYVRFWRGIDRVRIRGPITVRDNTVLVSLQFDPKGRGRTLERYQLVMGTAADGRVLIDASALLSSSAVRGGDRNGPDEQDNGGG